MQYRKKPVVIEAFRLGHDPMPDWFCDARSVNRVVTFNDRNEYSGGPSHAVIETLEGKMRADFGDWVIQGVKGEIYPCKPDIFDATYEPVVEIDWLRATPATIPQSRGCVCPGTLAAGCHSPVCPRRPSAFALGGWPHARA